MPDVIRKRKSNHPRCPKVRSVFASADPPGPAMANPVLALWEIGWVT